MVALCFCPTCERPLYAEALDTRCPVCFSEIVREAEPNGEPAGQAEAEDVA